MPQVITERARIGHDRRYHEVRHAKSRHSRDFEELPSHESMRRPFRQRWIAKQFNEHLSPLRRFLEKQAGRPWDDVHAEICKGLRANSTLHAHVRGHVRDYVETDICILGDGTYTRNVGGHRIPITSVMRWPYMIVCPRSGLLLRAADLPQVRQDKAEREAKEAAAAATNPLPIRLDAGTGLGRIAGIWYLVTYAVLPEPSPVCTKTLEPGDADPDHTEIRKAGYWLKDLGGGRRAVMQLVHTHRLDVVVGRHIHHGEMAPVRGAASNSWHTPTAPATYYAASKRQAPRALLLKHGLRNGDAS